jgi:Ca2+-binding RTX toxin-like protein
MRRPVAWRGAGALALVLLIGIAATEDEAGAAPPRCLGKPATIVGQGAIRGTAHADVIVAGRGRDRIDGRGGNDRICAGTGPDSIEGGVGSDRIDAGHGDDEVVGDNGSDVVLAGPGADAVIGKRGNDRLLGGPGRGDFLDSGLGDDTLDGGPGGFDQVIGGVGNDRLAGGDGDGDLLRPDFGRDAVDGGPGAQDTVSFAVSGEGSIVLDEGGVRVDLAAGTASGDGEDTLAGVEDVIGTPFVDVIGGGAGPNVLYGGGGVDDLVGAGPGDVAHGGVGKDRCRAVEAQDSCELPGITPYSATSEARFLELTETEGKAPARQPALEVDSTGTSGGGLSAVVDLPNFAAGRPGIEVTVSIADGAWLLSARGIAIATGDRCAAVSAETARCPFSGTPEAVLLSGSSAADTLRIDASVPATVSAFLRGYRGADTIEGGAGDDSLDGYVSRDGDVLRGGSGDDALTGGALMEGGAGSDLLIAFACNGEAIAGGAGVDSVSFARSDQGVEARIGGSASFAPGGTFPPGCPNQRDFPATSIAATVESIEGSAHDDVFHGNAGRNILLGRGGDDAIEGGGGEDFLVGGLGRDSLRGDRGEDRLYGRDDARDTLFDCGPGSRGDVAQIDPGDPRPRNCRLLGPRPGLHKDS